MMDSSNQSRQSCRPRKNLRRWIGASSSVFFVVGIGAVRASSTILSTKDSEYNFMILDPEHPYGSPYGGFSRASASRLASLPLMLPNVAESRDDFQPFFMKVTDAFGQSFSCRAYHEDELDPSTLKDGMFRPPVLREPNSEGDEESFEESGKDLSNTLVPEGSSSSSSPEQSIAFLREKVKENLSKLKGMCAHHHQGWWSYEWCFEGKVVQFHVKLNKKLVTIEDTTSLGDFKGKSITEVYSLDSTSVQDENAETKSDVVVEERSFHDDGEICPQTGRPRETEAVLRCCPPLKSSRKKNTVFHNGNPVETDLVYLKNVEESQVCSYTMTLCTPLLCDDQLLQEGQESLLEAPKPVGPAHRKEIENIQDLSISEAIDIFFQGEKKSICVLHLDGGWWAYEFCPGVYLRQFHEAIIMDRVTGVSSRVVETEFFLGRYDEESSRLPKEDEYQRIVNATMLPTGTSNKVKARSGAPLAHGGNGAYFYQEYTRGDVCDDEDVTDSAIKAGEVGEGLVERSTTVRYGCGSEFGLNIKEDSTCHYVADVTIPALCQHPFFRAPVSKKQVVKCIPDAP